MNSLDLLGLSIVILFTILIFFFTATRKRWPVKMRAIPAFRALGIAIERAVEGGQRIHISLGTGSLVARETAPALVGLSVLKRIISASGFSDRPTLVTTGNGALMILAQDTMQRAYQRVRASERYEPTAARMLGPTPYSYLATLPHIIKDEEVSVHILYGSFGMEGALATYFGERRDLFVISGTQDVQSQALMYALSNTTLIGEEVFAGGAYLNVHPTHRASLQAQDVVRWLLLLIILGGSILATIGDSL